MINLKYTKEELPQDILDKAYTEFPHPPDNGSLEDDIEHAKRMIYANGMMAERKKEKKALLMSKNMGYEKIKQILGIEILYITGEQIGKLVEECKGPDNAFSQLPTYVLTDEGKTQEARYWLQYTFEGKDTYILFNKAYADRYLAEEISNGGFEEIFKKVNLLPIFKQLPHIEFDSRALPITSRLVFDVIYSSSFNGESREYDCDIELVGYMDEDVNIHLIGSYQAVNKCHIYCQIVIKNCQKYFLTGFGS